MMLRILTFVVLSLHLFACVTTYKVQEEQVVHVVLIWLNEPGNEKHIDQIIDATSNLKEISQIQQLRVGEFIPSDRDIVDDSFDVGLYMTFSSVEDMKIYLDHPKHKNLVKTVLKPLISKVVVYDFADQAH